MGLAEAGADVVVFSADRTMTGEQTAAPGSVSGTTADRNGGTAADRTAAPAPNVGTAADRNGDTAAALNGGTASGRSGDTEADRNGGTTADRNDGTGADRNGGTTADRTAADPTAADRASFGGTMTGRTSSDGTTTDQTIPDRTITDRTPGPTPKRGSVRVIGCALPDGALALLRRRAAIGHLAAPLGFRRAVLAEHRRQKFDVVEATNWYAPAVLLPALRSADGAAVPLVVRHSTPAVMTAPDAGTLGVRDRADLAFADALERRVARRAALAIFNTAASAAIIAPLYGCPAGQPKTVVGLALPDATIAAGAAAPWPPPDPLSLAFVGRAEHRKGFDELIGAFALVRAMRPVRLHLVGTDPADDRRALSRLGLDARLADDITNQGRTDDATLHAVLGGCHLVVAPSRTESYGIVYREAAAFGRPLVAVADDASAREFIAATGAGLLAAACTAEAIAVAILRLVDDRALAATCRAAGLAHAATLTRSALGRATLAAYALVPPARG